MPASPVTSRGFTHSLPLASGITLGRRPSISNRQKVSSSGILSPSCHPKDSASPTNLRNIIRCSANSETKATSMPSSSLAAISTRSTVSGVRSEATSDSLTSFAAALARLTRTNTSFSALGCLYLRSSVYPQLCQQSASPLSRTHALCTGLPTSAKCAHGPCATTLPAVILESLRALTGVRIAPIHEPPKRRQAVKKPPRGPLLAPFLAESTFSGLLNPVRYHQLVRWGVFRQARLFSEVGQYTKTTAIWGSEIS